MNRGFIIEIEGTNGAGKTTLSKMLYENLKSKGYPVELVREPGGSYKAEKIRELAVIDDGTSKLGELTGFFLFMASRAQLIFDKAEKDLADGKILIYDRYEDSTRVYQGILANIGLMNVNTMLDSVFKDYKPAVTVLLDVEPSLGMERANRDGVDINKYDKQPLEYYKRVREAYRNIFDERIKTDKHCYILDSNRELEIVYEELLNVIEKEIKDRLKR
jgi:dTMP kinase